MNGVLNITKAMSDESRVRALMMLGGGELCVCQIIELLGLAPSTVSKHMSILKQAGLVESRKDGRWIYYRLADGEGAVKVILEWLMGNLKREAVVKRDLCELRRIKKLGREELCANNRS